MSGDWTGHGGASSAGSADSDLVDLCRHLRIDREAFEGHRQRYFATLARLLVFHEVVGETDMIEADSFRSAVREFQRSVGLEADGIPGEHTLWELNYSWTMANRLGLVSLDMDDGAPAGAAHADAEHGRLVVHVRADVAPAVAAWRTDLRAAGVPMISSGARRSFTDSTPSSGSDVSTHYGAAAVDLATSMGMTTQGPIDPDHQPYVVTSEGDRWRVWARSESGTEARLEAVSWTRGVLEVRSREGRFLDVTAIAASHGMTAIRPRSSFPADYTGANWWHFQSDAALVPWISQFGCEILRLQANSEASFHAQRALWLRRKRIFRPSAKAVALT